MIIKDKKGLHIRRAKAMLVTPYVYDKTIGDYVLFQNTYDITKIVANSMEIVQADTDIEVKTNEFSKEPVLVNMIRGNFTFSVECIDFGNTIMKVIYGYPIGRDEKNNEIDGAVALVDQNRPIYCSIHIKFDDTPDIVLPLVKLDTNVTIGNLKSKGSNVIIKGYLRSKKAIVYNKNSALKFYVNDKYIYNPYASIYFVPKNYEIAFYKKDGDYDSEEYYTTEIDAKEKKIDLNNGFLR